jgi:Ca2+-binding RTX toxin-like protein
VFGSSSVALEIISADGRQARSAWSVFSSYSGDPANAPDGPEVVDLRAISGNRFAVAGRAGASKYAIVRGDGTVESEATHGFLARLFHRFSPTGEIVTKPGSITDAYREPAAPATSIYVEDAFEVLGDGDTIAVGLLDVRGKARLVAQRFDGSPADANDTPGSARIVNGGAELVVRGTAAADRVSVRYHAGAFRVRINDAPPQVFASRDFDRLTIIADGGDDAVDVRLGATDKPASIRGGTGNDRIFADFVTLAIQGDAGDDVIRAGPTRNVGGTEGRIEGGDGRDSLVGSDEIYGGAGDDTLVGTDAYEAVTGFPGHLYGEDGNDRIYGRAGGGRSLYGGNGDDTLVGATTETGFNGGAGVDVAYFTLRRPQFDEFNFNDIERRRQLAI